MTEEHPLTPQPTLAVYKASAGSGKTFTLTIEYIKLLLHNPYAYEKSYFCIIPMRMRTSWL